MLSKGRFSWFAGRESMFCLVAVALLMQLAGATAAAVDLVVSARAGDRPALLFADNEAVRISARIVGGTGPVQLDYAARETCGPWTAAGSVAIARDGDGTVEAPLPLSFPNRGHYQLTLTAKCGDLTANETTTAAVVYPPQPATPDSLWGIMYGVYRGYPSHLDQQDRPAQIAASMRLLGASWTRLNFWLHMYTISVKDGQVVLDLSQVRRQVDEFRKQGINILGEIVQTPRILSSKPDANDAKGDGGPLFCRVKPADYRLWDQMVEQIAREFKDDIQVWEVWNEVAGGGHFWVGTAEEFVELLEHTSAALRRGNPNAKIAGPGFTSSVALCEPFFKAGIGKYLDILSVHYTDRKDRVAEYQALQEKYGLALPIENTEESTLVPLNNLARGIRSHKYIHLHAPSNNTYRPLMTMDWKLHPTAVTYAVGAHVLGAKTFCSSKELPGFKVYFFGAGAGAGAGLAVVVAHRGEGPARFLDGQSIDRVRIKAVPAAGQEVVGIDSLGRETPFPGGEGELPFSQSASMFTENSGIIFAAPDCVFIRGCQDIVAIDRVGQSSLIVAEAEDGDYDREAFGASQNPEYSGGKYLNIWQKNPPGEKGYGVDLKIDVPADGDYRVLFSGNNLARIIKKPTSLSPFYWSFDDGPRTPVGEQALDMFGDIVGGIDGAPEGMATLGTVHLTKGQRVFHLRLTAPRETDQHWALWIDAIALVPVR